MGQEIGSNALRTREMDRIFKALSEHQRRLILLLLDNGELEHERDLVVRGERDADADAVQIQLHHNHLPKLAEADYIDWDRETGEITKGSCFDEVAPVLRLMENHAEELPPGWP